MLLVDKLQSHPWTFFICLAMRKTNRVGPWKYVDVITIMPACLSPMSKRPWGKTQKTKNWVSLCVWVFLCLIIWLKLPPSTWENRSLRPVGPHQRGSNSTLIYWILWESRRESPARINKHSCLHENTESRLPHMVFWSPTVLCTYRSLAIPRRKRGKLLVPGVYKCHALSI